MIDDPIVENTRKAREETVLECGEDVHAFFEYVRERERRNGRDAVALTPNVPESSMQGSDPR
jgi:hypothetical protein